MDSQNQEEHQFLRTPVNYYAVCDDEARVVLHIAKTREECERFIREKDFENIRTSIWHLHDMDIHTTKPLYNYNEK